MGNAPKRRRKTKKKGLIAPSIKRRKDEYYSAGELFMAGLGVFVLILVAGLIITSLIN